MNPGTESVTIVIYRGIRLPKVCTYPGCALGCAEWVAGFTVSPNSVWESQFTKMDKFYVNGDFETPTIIGETLIPSGFVLITSMGDKHVTIEVVAGAIAGQLVGKTIYHAVLYINGIRTEWKEQHVRAISQIHTYDEYASMEAYHHYLCDFERCAELELEQLFSIDCSA